MNQQQSDTDLRRRVERALNQFDACNLKTVRCSVNSSTVTLRGEVNSYHSKQLAQTLVMKLPHVLRVHNELVVGRHSLFSPRPHFTQVLSDPGRCS